MVAIYEIRVESRARTGWHQLKKDHLDEMTEFIAFLERHPSNTRVTKGRLKKLKGRLSQYYQYDVTYFSRVRYEIDKSAKIIPMLVDIRSKRFFVNLAIISIVRPYSIARSTSMF